MKRTEKRPDIFHEREDTAVGSPQEVEDQYRVRVSMISCNHAPKGWNDQNSADIASLTAAIAGREIKKDSFTTTIQPYYDSFRLKNFTISMWYNNLEAKDQDHIRHSVLGVIVYDINQPDYGQIEKTIQRFKEVTYSEHSKKSRPFILIEMSPRQGSKAANDAGKNIAQKHGVNFMKVSISNKENITALQGLIKSELDNMFKNPEPQAAPQVSTQSEPTPPDLCMIL